MNPEQQAHQVIANMPNQLLGNLVNLAKQHWLAVAFLIGVVCLKVYVDLKTSARKGRERRQRNH